MDQNALVIPVKMLQACQTIHLRYSYNNLFSLRDWVRLKMGKGGKPSGTHENNHTGNPRTIQHLPPAPCSFSQIYENQTPWYHDLFQDTFALSHAWVNFLGVPGGGKNVSGMPNSYFMRWICGSESRYLQTNRTLLLCRVTSAHPQGARWRAAVASDVSRD